MFRVEWLTFAGMEIVVRKGRKEDIPSILGLIRELAEYEKALEEVVNTAEDMEKDGFGPEPVFRSMVAEAGGRIAGAAVYFIKYSTWKGKGVYLDDIVVTAPLRGKGIGSKLFEAVMDDARAMGARQMHWQVLDWNEPAIRFYRKYDARFDDEWINCKLEWPHQ